MKCFKLFLVSLLAKKSRCSEGDGKEKSLLRQDAGSNAHPSSTVEFSSTMLFFDEEGEIHPVKIKSNHTRERNTTDDECKDLLLPLQSAL